MMREGSRAARGCGAARDTGRRACWLLRFVALQCDCGERRSGVPAGGRAGHSVPAAHVDVDGAIVALDLVLQEQRHLRGQGQARRQASRAQRKRVCRARLCAGPCRRGSAAAVPCAQHALATPAQHARLRLVLRLHKQTLADLCLPTCGYGPGYTKVRDHWRTLTFLSWKKARSAIRSMRKEEGALAACAP